MSYLVEQLPYCDLLRLSPLTGWFVLSARQVVRRIGLWSCCCSFKGRVFSRERESSAFFIWPSHQRPATPVLSFGREKNLKLWQTSYSRFELWAWKKSKVVADQLLPFQTFGSKKFFNWPSSIFYSKLWQTSYSRFGHLVWKDFWIWPSQSTRAFCTGALAFFIWIFLTPPPTFEKKNVGGGIKKNWRWCQIFVKNLCQKSLSRIFVKNLCQIMKLAFFYGGGGIFLEAEASFFRRRRRT